MKIKSTYIPFSDEYFMKLALNEANKSLKYNDVPIGAVIVKDNIIIGRGHNHIQRKGNPLLHAEIVTINSAIKKIGYKHLYECTMYITLEPCTMCCGAIVLSRIKKVVYGATDPKTGSAMSLNKLLTDSRMNHRCELEYGILENECSIILKDFFKMLRQKNKK